MSIYCLKCESECPDDAQVCPACGHPLTENAELMLRAESWGKTRRLRRHRFVARCVVTALALIAVLLGIRLIMPPGPDSPGELRSKTTSIPERSWSDDAGAVLRLGISEAQVKHLYNQDTGWTWDKEGTEETLPET
ncbi:MAG: hypothetical protein PVI86_12220, partial [Phycisphaerae bacterium]